MKELRSKEGKGRYRQKKQPQEEGKRDMGRRKERKEKGRRKRRMKGKEGNKER